MGRQFESTLDFGGNYVGRFDGRNGRLEVNQVYAIYPPNSYSFVVTFIDLDRNQTFSNSGNAHIEDTGPQGHKITNLVLYGPQGAQVTFSRLLLHTWDIDFISGESVWNGQEYGAFFTRS